MIIILSLLQDFYCNSCHQSITGC